MPPALGTPTCLPNHWCGWFPLRTDLHDTRSLSWLVSGHPDGCCTCLLDGSECCRCPAGTAGSRCERLFSTTLSRRCQDPASLVQANIQTGERSLDLDFRNPSVSGDHAFWQHRTRCLAFYPDPLYDLKDASKLICLGPIQICDTFQGVETVFLGSLAAS